MLTSIMPLCVMAQCVTPLCVLPASLLALQLLVLYPYALCLLALYLLELHLLTLYLFASCVLTFNANLRSVYLLYTSALCLFSVRLLNWFMPFGVMPASVMPTCVTCTCFIPLCVKSLCVTPLCVMTNRRTSLLPLSFSINHAFIIAMILFRLLSIEVCHRYTSIPTSGDGICPQFLGGLEECSKKKTKTKQSLSNVKFVSYVCVFETEIIKHSYFFICHQVSLSCYFITCIQVTQPRYHAPKPG